MGADHVLLEARHLHDVVLLRARGELLSHTNTNTQRTGGEIVCGVCRACVCVIVRVCGEGSYRVRALVLAEHVALEFGDGLVAGDAELLGRRLDLVLLVGRLVGEDDERVGQVQRQRLRLPVNFINQFNEM